MTAALRVGRGVGTGGGGGDGGYGKELRGGGSLSFGGGGGGLPLPWVLVFAVFAGSTLGVIVTAMLMVLLLRPHAFYVYVFPCMRTVRAPRPPPHCSEPAGLLASQPRERLGRGRSVRRAP
jgi:hypothetical protein